ncbi:MAG: hypothetical protein AAF438_05125 [Pseudomonadota bacterium]
MTTRIDAVLAATIAFNSLAQPCAAEVIEERRSWSETYEVTTSNPQLSISNIWGGIQVKKGDGQQIRVSIDELRSAPSQARFDKSLKVLKLETTADGESVSFVVEVPANTSLSLSTVNDGHIQVQDVVGTVSARNVNGSVMLNGVATCEEINSVNGPVRVQFSNAPISACDIETINGDVTLKFPAVANLDLAFDLFNGRLTSDVEVTPVSLPARVEQRGNVGSFKYRIEQPAGVRIGSGGPRFSVKSMNGDIRILENQ